MSDLQNLPRHVAIIMDGNGRWAKNRGLPRLMGHRKGVEALRNVIRASSDWGIEVLSLYAFSTENWKRSQEEVGALMGLLLEYFLKEIDELSENQVCIRILGNVDGLPERQREAVIRAMDRTRYNRGLQLNIALNYGGRDEIVRAVKTLCQQVLSGERSIDGIDEHVFANALDTANQPDIDLVIRTSGEMRLSNFLLYQAAYAELFFPDVLWPDFTEECYRALLSTYQSRERRFGGREPRRTPCQNAP